MELHLSEYFCFSCFLKIVLVTLNNVLIVMTILDFYLVNERRLLLNLGTKKKLSSRGGTILESFFYLI